MGEKFALEFGFTVDWVSATFDEQKGLEFCKDMGYGGMLKDVESVPPKGYNQARELESGLRLAWHDYLSSQGLHVQMSGAALRWYYAHGNDWLSILKTVKRHGGRTSRVDLAIDVRNSTLSLTNLAKNTLRPYKGRGRTPKLLPVGTVEDGWTVYVGARSSDKFLRVYDKAKEQGDYVGNYVRIELECKGEVAHAIGHEFPEMDVSDCIRVAQTLIRGQADFNNSDWDAALKSEHLALTIPQGKERQTMQWLVKICAPALAKEIVRRPSVDVLNAFWDALTEELKERGYDFGMPF